VGDLLDIIMVAGLFCLLSAMCFSELTSLYPSAAGIKLFIRNAFNERIATIIGCSMSCSAYPWWVRTSYILSSVMISAHTFISRCLTDHLVEHLILFVAFLNYRG